MALRIRIQKSVRKIEEIQLSLDSKAIIGLLRKEGYEVPINAEVTFKVPTGGDYSGTTLHLESDSDCTIGVFYKEITEGDS
jgi:hypothetical protein